MALSGRVRSALPLLNSVLRTESSIAASADQSFASPSIAGLRNFSIQAKTSSQSGAKVPLSLFGGSGNYASAQFLAASKANLLDKFIKDLSVPRETRVKVITEIFAEASFSDVTKDFLAVLADNGRLKHIDRISKRFVELTMTHKGEVKVVVTTVIPLPAEVEKELKKTLQEILQGNTVHLEQKINPSILGGLIIEFGQKVFDMSIKTRAKQMEQYLRQPVGI